MHDTNNCCFFVLVYRDVISKHESKSEGTPAPSNSISASDSVAKSVEVTETAVSQPVVSEKSIQQTTEAPETQVQQPEVPVPPSVDHEETLLQTVTVPERPTIESTCTTSESNCSAPDTAQRHSVEKSGDSEINER